MFPLSLLKVLFFLLAWIITWLPVAIPLSYKINYQFPQIPTVNQKLILLASLYPFALIIIGLILRWESIGWSTIGWQWQGKGWLFLVWGIILALVSLIAIFSLEFASGLVTCHWHNSPRLISLIIPVFCLSLGISFVEESIFRGFLINELIRDFSDWLSAIASSIIFALLHLVWEREKTIPQLPGLWVMGMVLVLARIVAGGNLGLAIGLHTGWIFGLTCLDSAELISYVPKQSKQWLWLTGIDQQPLAGIFGILGLLLTGVVLLVFSRF
jgi:uncharacterized protein